MTSEGPLLAPGGPLSDVDHSLIPGVRPCPKGTPVSYTEATLKRLMGFSLILGLAVFGSVLVSPRPCAACSPLEPETEELTLELESVAIDGLQVTPDPSYADFATFLQADTYSDDVFFIFRGESENFVDVFR